MLLQHFVFKIITPLMLLAAVSAANAESVGTTTLHRLTVGTLVRSYLFRSPPAPGGDALQPLLIVLHGGTENARKVISETNFDQVADKHGFYAVFPEAIAGNWNDGRYNPKQTDQSRGVDDVAFISALIDELVATRNIDPLRVFVTGPSNGGMMTFRVGCELAHKVAGIAPAIASIPKNYNCKPSRPIPVMMINGTGDPLMPYEGGAIHGIFGEYRGMVSGVSQTARFWGERNGCRGLPRVKLLPHRTFINFVRVTIETRRCEVPFVEVTALGGGHRWFGRVHPLKIEALLTLFAGESTRDFDSSDEIREFFGLSMDPLGGTDP